MLNMTLGVCLYITPHCTDAYIMRTWSDALFHQKRNVHATKISNEFTVVGLMRLNTSAEKNQQSLKRYFVCSTRTSKNHHSYSFQNISAQSDQYLHSFLSRTIRTWNLLPQDIVTVPSPGSFRLKLVKSIKDGLILI